MMTSVDIFHCLFGKLFILQTLNVTLEEWSYVEVCAAICFNFLYSAQSSALEGNFPGSRCFYGCHRGSGDPPLNLATPREGVFCEAKSLWRIGLRSAVTLQQKTYAVSAGHRPWVMRDHQLVRE